MTFKILCPPPPGGGAGLLRPGQSSIDPPWRFEDDRDLRTRDARLAAIINASNDAIVSVGLNRIVLTWNPAAAAMFRYDEHEALGRSIDELIVSPDELEGRADQFSIFPAEKPVRFESMRQRRDGALLPVAITITPIRDHNDRTVAIAVNFRDISERRRSDEKAAALIGEVEHRSMNLLAMVQGIADLSFAGAPEHLLKLFNGRLRALAASHRLLVANSEQETDIADLVSAQLGHFCGGSDARMAIMGPPLGLSPSAAQALGMALHELATNAAKYGAFSNLRGSVDFRWELMLDGGQRRFVASWTERGGPKVVPPKRRGFGSSVVGSLIESALGGSVALDFAAEGLTWRLECPATNLS